MCSPDKSIEISCLTVYCQTNKGLHVHAWVIMSNHVHAILSTPEADLSDVIRDLKGHTSKAIVKAVQQENESRREWMLARFVVNAISTARNDQFKVWTHENHPLQLQSFTIRQRVEYIHQNPVRAGWVDQPRDYRYSSARDYQDEPGLLKVDRLW
ncbi:MAG TPA: transposase [Flavobacteriales bacterium]|nr:transposase [Flavobacteriales bacterium]HNU56951.1 transposase [Flavobacteriales bacterium]